LLELVYKYFAAVKRFRPQFTFQNSSQSMTGYIVVHNIAMNIFLLLWIEPWRTYIII